MGGGTMQFSLFRNNTIHIQPVQNTDSPSMSNNYSLHKWKSFFRVQEDEQFR